METVGNLSSMASSEGNLTKKVVRVLYVERGLDVKICAEILQSSTSLLTFPIVFDVVTDGLEALDALRRSNFELVFIADNLRPLRHIDVLRVIHTMSFSVGIVVVRTERTQRPGDSSAQFFIQKPFSAMDLCTAIVNQLRTRIPIEQLMISLMASEDVSHACSPVVLSESENSYLQEQISANLAVPTNQQTGSKQKKSATRGKAATIAKRSLIPIIPKAGSSSSSSSAEIDTSSHSGMTFKRSRVVDVSFEDLQHLQSPDSNNNWPSIFTSMSPDQLFNIDLGSPIHEVAAGEEVEDDEQA